MNKAMKMPIPVKLVNGKYISPGDNNGKSFSLSEVHAALRKAEKNEDGWVMMTIEEVMKFNKERVL